MSRLSLLALVVALGCGGKSTPPPTTPLPEDKPATPVATTPAPPPKPEPPPPAPGPLDVAIEAPQTTVKLVNAGKGKKTPLAYASAATPSEQVDLTFDFVEKHFAPAELGGDGQNGMPTIIFSTEAIGTTVDKTAIEYTMKVSKTDAKDVEGARIKAEELKGALDTLKDFTIKGKVGPNGVALEPTKISVGVGDQVAQQIVNLMQIALPSWPALPTEAVGDGAKWTATTNMKLMGQVDVTVVTDYTLVKRKGTAATIKGTTKVSGVEQSKGPSKISDIAGTGTIDGTIDSAHVFPQFVSSLDATFSVSEQDKAIKLQVKIGGQMTPASMPAPPVVEAKPDPKAKVEAKKPDAKTPAPKPEAKK
ncbi:MAG TPA: DUF6263 family protein [Kofleriaceae bacterium]|jgi:hypothetical protein